MNLLKRNVQPHVSTKSLEFPVFDPQAHPDEDFRYDQLQRGREYTSYARSSISIDTIDETRQEPVATEQKIYIPNHGKTCDDCLLITTEPYERGRLMSTDFRLRWKSDWTELEDSASSGCPCCCYIKYHLEIEAGRAQGMSIPTSASLIISSAPQGQFVPTRNGSCGSIMISYDQRFYGSHFINPIWLNCFTFSNDPAASDPGLVCRQPAHHSGSDQSLQWIKQQMKRCIESHRSCQMVDPPTLPTRVVYVGKRRLHRDPKLVISNGQKARYTAFSHCWGPETKPFFKLMTADIDLYQKRLPFSTLPENFQDAIHITRALRIDYIWVDALCIVQDDISDWAVEAPKMASVYSQAALTIVANGSGSCYDGFLHERPRMEFSEVKLPFQSHLMSQPGHIYLKLEEAVEDQLDIHLSQPVQHRAWCLQERLLSTRVIHFDKDQLVWQCRKGILLESRTEFIMSERMQLSSLSNTSILNGLSLLKPAPAGQSPSPERQVSTLAAWYRIVDIYATKLLTSSTDVLPAFAGLAEHFETLSIGSYIAGLWTFNLPGQLLWTMRQLSTHQIPQPTLQQLETTYAPSWSWASRVPICTGTGVTFRSDPSLSKPLSARTYLSTLQHYILSPRFPDTGTKGQMLSARLTLEGPTKRISILHGARNVLGGSHLPCSSDGSNDWHQWLADLDPDFQHHCNAKCTWNRKPILSAAELHTCGQDGDFIFLLLEKDRNWRGLVLQAVVGDTVDTGGIASQLGDSSISGGGGGGGGGGVKEYRRIGVFDHQPRPEHRLPGNSKESSDEAMSGWEVRLVTLV